MLELLAILLQHLLQSSGAINRDIVCTLGLVNDSDLSLDISSVNLDHARFHVALKHWLSNLFTAVESTQVRLLLFGFSLVCWVEIMSVLILVVELTKSGSLEGENVLILSSKSLRDLSHLLGDLVLLLSSVLLEADAKLDLSVLRQKLQLRVLNQPLEHLWEGFEDLAVEGHAPPALAERATGDLLVAVLEDVQLHLDVNLVEEGPVSDVNPLDNVVQVLHRLPVELEEIQFVQQSVQVLEEWWQLVLEQILVQVDQRLGKRVVQEVELVGGAHGAIS